MDVTRALELLREAVGNSSQVRVAERVRVSNGTVSRWLARKSKPVGEEAEKLVAWAADYDGARSIPAAILEAAQKETAANRRRLAYIMGQAEAVATMLEGVLASQRAVVDSLRPWVTLEETLDHDAAVEARALAVTQHVAGRAPTPPTTGGSPRPETDATGSRTASPQGTAPTAKASRRKG